MSNAIATGQAPVVRSVLAPPPTPCPSCGVTAWTSLALADGTVKHEAKCNGCGFERDIVFDPFTGPRAANAEQVSPWETHRPAIAKLRWFFSQSDGDLGAHSSWESKVQQANFGASISPAIDLIAGEPTAQTPNDGRIWAAKRWAGIAAVLKACTRATHGLFEWVFSLRRADTQITGLFDRDTEPVVSYLVATRQISLKGLKKPEDRHGVRAAAERLLEAALTEFELRELEIRGVLGDPIPRRFMPEPELRPAGACGASKRRLVPVEIARERWVAPRDA